MIYLKGTQVIERKPNTGCMKNLMPSLPSDRDIKYVHIWYAKYSSYANSNLSYIIDYFDDVSLNRQIQLNNVNL
jgi:hypothetical protein